MTIVQKNNLTLRQTAKEVPVSEIRSARIKRIIKIMKDDLGSQSDGVAIAAPQIGEPLRIFVISKRIFELEQNADIENGEGEKKINGTSEEKFKDLVFINPVIVKLSRNKKMMDEGCLSVRYFYGKVKRSVKTTIKAYDENGQSFVRGASGLLAQAFQHETDHLNGILFTDKATEIMEIKPENVEKY